MIKKSEVQALLEGFPEEFEAERLHILADEMSDFPLSATQIEGLRESEEDLAKNGPLSVEEFRKEMKEWVAARFS